jgi:hypothetical protein
LTPPTGFGAGVMRGKRTPGSGRLAGEIVAGDMV